MTPDQLKAWGEERRRRVLAGVWDDYLDHLDRAGGEDHAREYNTEMAGRNAPREPTKCPTSRV
jgi:hypothetical protein